MSQYIRFDWVIKYMLRDKSNYEIVEGFLSELLKQQIIIQDILESESNKQQFDNKLNRVDILVKNEQDELIIIELQYETEWDYFHRILYGASNLISQYIQQGQSYYHIKKVISVSIVYFDLGEGEDYIYHGITEFKGLHKSDILQLNTKQKKLFTCEQISQIYPEYFLIKVNNFPNRIQSTLDEWIYFFKTDDIEPDFSAQGLHTAKEKLDVLKLSEDERKAYQRYMENVRYENSMSESKWQEGFLEGEEKKAIEIAKNLLLIMNDQQIGEVTGLDIQVIQQLRDK
jgi:predicted transposase/invertase (TIGR01784 family)